MPDDKCDALDAINDDDLVFFQVKLRLTRLLGEVKRNGARSWRKAQGLDKVGR